MENVYFVSVGGFLRHRQPLPPEGDRIGKGPGFPLHSWTLGGRAVVGGKTEAKRGSEIATGQERFEQGGRSRFQSMCVQLRVHGLRRLAMGHAQRLPTHGQLSRAVVHNLSRSMPGDEHHGELGPRNTAALPRPICKASWASRPGTPSARSTSSSSLPRWTPRARTAITGAEWRRHADDGARGDRLLRDSLVSRRDGQHRDARAAARVKTPVCSA